MALMLSEALTLCGVLCLRAVCLSVPMTCCVMGREQAVRRPGLEPWTPALLRPPARRLAM
eukprot:COSAG01_NODE_54299_length_330_cov_0.628205_1_plen_59_part_01